MRRKRIHAAGLVALTMLWIALGFAWSKNAKEKLQEAMDDFLIEGDWNYDDIERGFSIARRNGKPVLVVFR